MGVFRYTYNRHRIDVGSINSGIFWDIIYLGSLYLVFFWLSRVLIPVFKLDCCIFSKVIVVGLLQCILPLFCYTIVVFAIVVFVVYFHVV